MNISYDDRVDAVYIKLIPGDHEVHTHVVDDDIALDLDGADRLVGVEVLDASKRLDLSYLFPVDVSYARDGSKSRRGGGSVVLSDSTWSNLQRELGWRKANRVPVKTLVQGRKNRVDEVHDDCVILQREDSGKKVTVTRGEIEELDVEGLKHKRKSAITRALRALASTL